MVQIERFDEARFLDPITEELMVDPVVCNDGHTYDRASAVRAQQSPFTHKPLRIVVDNIDLRAELFDLFPEQQSLYNAKVHDAPTSGALKLPSSIKVPKSWKPMVKSAGVMGNQLVGSVGKQWNKWTDKNEEAQQKKKENTKRFENDLLKQELRRIEGLIDEANAQKEEAIAMGDRNAAVAAITRRNNLQRQEQSLKQAMDVAVELTDVESSDSDSDSDSATLLSL